MREYVDIYEGISQSSKEVLAHHLPPKKILNSIAVYLSHSQTETPYQGLFTEILKTPDDILEQLAAEALSTQYTPLEQQTPHIVICGPPASGKSTLVETVINSCTFPAHNALHKYSDFRYPLESELALTRKSPYAEEDFINRIVDSFDSLLYRHMQQARDTAADLTIAHGGLLHFIVSRFTVWGFFDDETAQDTLYQYIAQLHSIDRPRPTVTIFSDVSKEESMARAINEAKQAAGQRGDTDWENTAAWIKRKSTYPYFDAIRYHTRQVLSYIPATIYLSNSMTEDDITQVITIIQDQLPLHQTFPTAHPQVIHALEQDLV